MVLIRCSCAAYSTVFSRKLLIVRIAISSCSSYAFSAIRQAKLLILRILQIQNQDKLFIFADVYISYVEMVGILQRLHLHIFLSSFRRRCSAMKTLNTIVDTIPRTYTGTLVFSACLLIAVSLLRAQLDTGQLTSPISTISSSPSTISTFILWPSSLAQKSHPSRASPSSLPTSKVNSTSIFAISTQSMAQLPVPPPTSLARQLPACGKTFIKSVLA